MCGHPLPAPFNKHLGRIVLPPAPAAPLQVYTSSQDGTLKLWDLATGECLRTYPIGQPLEHMVRSGGRCLLLRG